MARRVNKKFVAGLAGLLLAGTAGGLVVVGRYYLHTHDPAWLTAMAEDAEKKGDPVSAVRLYGRAADVASRKHTADAAQRWEKAGNLAYQLSQTEKSPELASQYYKTAEGDWGQALVQNPRYLPVLTRQLDLQHAWARVVNSPAWWQQLQDLASRVIGAKPDDAGAYAVRAEAILGGIRSISQTDLPTKALADADADVKKALELDKDNEDAAALGVKVRTLRSILARVQTQGDTEKNEIAGAIADGQAFLKSHPGSPTVSVALADAYQYSNDRAGAIEVLQAALAKNPGNLNVTAKLISLYPRDLAKGEALAKALVEASADKGPAYQQLARVYEDNGKTEEAIEAWKAAAANPRLGGGQMAQLAQVEQMSALTTVSWYYMDLAERKGVDSAAGKDYLAQAAATEDKLRAAHVSKGYLEMLDGRMDLIHQNLPRGIQSLRNAEAEFGQPNLREWLWTKQKLALGYEMQTEWGLAREELDQILTSFPTLLQPKLERAQDLIHMGQFNAALAEVDPLVKMQGLSPEAIKMAQTIQAQAYMRLGDPEHAKGVWADIGTPEALLQSARDMLQDGDPEGALQRVDQVLAKNDTNLSALYLGVLAASQAKKQDLAATYVERGLKVEPDNTQFKLLDAALKNAGGDVKAAQLKVLEAITDPLVRDLSLAQTYVAQGDPAKALEMYQAAEKDVETAADNAPSGAMNQVVSRAFGLAIQLAVQAPDDASRAKYFAVADQYVQKAERLDLDGVKGQFYLGQMELAQGGEKAKAALGLLEQAVASRPDMSLGHVYLAEAYLAQTPPRPDPALDQLRQALTQKPDNQVALELAVELLVQKGDAASVHEATQDYTQGLAYFPRDKVLTSMGDVLGDPADAIRSREAIRAKEPDNVENVRRLALLYSRQGMPAKAIEVLRPQYDKAPDVKVANFLAEKYVDLKQPDEGLKLFDPFIAGSDAAVKTQALLLKGELLRTLGKGDDAVACYEEARSVEPKGQDEAERLLADYEFDTNQLAKAEVLYQQVQENAKGSDLKVAYRLAETEVRQGKFKEADALLNGLLAKQPHDAKATVLAASSQLSQGKPQAAESLLEGLLQREPNNTDALFYQASCLLAMNQKLDVAAQDLLSVRDAKTGSAMTLEGQLNTRLLLARVLRQSRQYLECAGTYEEAINRLSTVPSLRVDYAQYLLWLLGMEQKLAPTDSGPTAFAIRSVRAEQRLKQLLDNSEKAYPGAPVWQVLAGELDGVKGNVAAARDRLATAYQGANGDLSTSVAYLTALLETKDYTTAVQVATKELGTHADNVDLLVKLGQAHAGVGKMDEARKDFDAAMAGVGRNVQNAAGVEAVATDALGADATADMLKRRLAGHADELGTKLAYADALLKAERGGEAVPVLTEVLSDPTGQEGRQVALHELGMAKYQAKDFKGAYDAYTAVLKDEPNDPQTLNNLAYMLLEDMKQPDKGLEYAARAVEALRGGSPEGLVLTQGSVLDTYGWAKYRTGDKEGAIAELKRASEMDALPETYLHLAKVYKDVGRVDEARKAVDQGLRVAGASKDPTAVELAGMKKELGS